MRSPRDAGLHSEAGFTLAEVIVALSIVTAVALATAPFFFRSIQREHGQGLRQTAVTVAGQRLDSIRGLTPSTLLTGRTASSVATIIGSPGLVDLSQDFTSGTGINANYDPSAGAGAKPIVPTSVTEHLNNTDFTVLTYIDPCYRASTTSSCIADPTSGTRMLRVSVDVSWPRGPAESCSSGRLNQCEFVTETLIDPTVGDPVFNKNVSQPTVTSMTPVTPTPTTVHPGQAVNVVMQGTNFVYGGIMTSDDPSDSFASVTTNTGVSANATLTAGSNLGQRLFRFQNPDGGNGGSAPTTSFTVTKSSPTLTSVTSTPSVAGAPATVTVVGTDLYTTLNLSSAIVPPTVTVVETSAGVPTTLAPTNVLLSGTTLTTVVTLSPTKGTYTLTATVTNIDTGTATRTSASGTAQ